MSLDVHLRCHSASCSSRLSALVCSQAMVVRRGPPWQELRREPAVASGTDPGVAGPHTGPAEEEPHTGQALEGTDPAGEDTVQAAVCRTELDLAYPGCQFFLSTLNSELNTYGG